MSRSTRLGHRARFGELPRTRVHRLNAFPVARARARDIYTATKETHIRRGEKQILRLSFCARVYPSIRPRVARANRKSSLRKTRTTIYPSYGNERASPSFSSAFNTGRNFYGHSHGNLQREPFSGRLTDQPPPPRDIANLPSSARAIFTKLPSATPGSFSLLDVDLFDAGKNRRFGAFTRRPRKTSELHGLLVPALIVIVVVAFYG